MWELGLASRWPEGGDELGGEERRGGRKASAWSQRLWEGGGRRLEGLLSRRSGRACGAHTWWGAFGLGLWVGPEFSMLQKYFTYEPSSYSESLSLSKQVQSIVLGPCLVPKTEKFSEL